MIFLVELHNRPGALCAFLQSLATVNITRIESRAVRGHPGVSFFLLEMEAEPAVVSRVIIDASRAAVQLQVLGAWPDTDHGFVVLMTPRLDVEVEDDPSKEWYFVGGVRYCVVCRTRRCKRQVGGTLDCVPEPIARVHILFQGRPRCGFSTQIPRDWSDGHRWVSDRDVAYATCQSCLDARVRAVAAELDTLPAMSDGWPGGREGNE